MLNDTIKLASVQDSSEQSDNKAALSHVGTTAESCSIWDARSHAWAQSQGGRH